MTFPLHNLRLLFVFLGTFLWVIASIAPKVDASSLRYLWEDQSDGLWSVDVTCVQVDPTRASRIYVAADGILYRSEDFGMNWKRLYRFRGSSRSSSGSLRSSSDFQQLKQKILEQKLEDLQNGRERDLSKSDTRELERQAEEEAEDQLSQQKSTTTGSLSTSAGRINRIVRRISVSPLNPSVLLVATDGGAFLSINQGKSFRAVFSGRGGGESNVFVSFVHPFQKKWMFLGTQKGLWISKDGGKLWKRAFGKLRNFAIREIRQHPTDRQILYVATNRSLFVSTDAGKTFSEKYAMPTRSMDISSMAVLLRQKQVQVFLATSRGLFVGDSSYQFQKQSARGFGSQRIFYITSTPSQRDFLYMITDQGVFFSRNAGRKFVQLRTGLLTQNIRFISVSQQDGFDIWAATDYGAVRWSKTISGRLTKSSWARWKKKIQKEPTVSALVSQMLEFLQLHESFAKLHDRQRNFQWLPRFQILGRIFLYDNKARLFLNDVEPYARRESREIRVYSVLQWNLGEVLSNSRQISWYKDLLSLRKKRHKYIQKVVRLYHARRRLQLRLFSSPPKEFIRYIRLKLKIQEITAYLNGLSNGAFSRGSSFGKDK